MVGERYANSGRDDQLLLKRVPDILCGIGMSDESTLGSDNGVPAVEVTTDDGRRRFHLGRNSHLAAGSCF